MDGIGGKLAGDVKADVEAELEAGFGMLRSLFWRIVAFFHCAPTGTYHMHIVAIAWIYVVLMMSITEESVVAGIMTFVLYGAFPLSIILYVMKTPERRRKRLEAEKISRDEKAANAAPVTVQQKKTEAE